jgi:two-component system, chemotaxis family, protein-glutamate methylesterase/glutaminase
LDRVHSSSMNNEPIKVLIVDNSIFMRTLVSSMLDSDPDIEVVDTARSGPEALEKILDLKPDVITLDLMMPGWDGLTTLKKIMSDCPTAVVILSAHSQEGAEITLKCITAGAISSVLKPSGELSLDIDQVKEQLSQEIKAASMIQPERVKKLVAKKSKSEKVQYAYNHRIVVIGASTGGPQTLETILPLLPADFPLPIVVVQHTPSVYMSQCLADRFDDVSALNVKLASHGEVIKRGTVYIAPSKFQCMVDCIEGEVVFEIKKVEGEVLTPSVDAAMESLAERYRDGTLGIILTGIGHDGVKGMKAIKRCGGQTLAQDESALIFGMPQEVIEAGAADKALPAEEIAEAIVEFATRMHSSSSKVRSSELGGVREDG